jgi:hypothetical protein
MAECRRFHHFFLVSRWSIMLSLHAHNFGASWRQHFTKTMPNSSSCLRRCAMFVISFLNVLTWKHDTFFFGQEEAFMVLIILFPIFQMQALSMCMPDCNCMRPTKGVTQVACHSFCSRFAACFIVINVAVTFDPINTNCNLSLFPSQKLSFVAIF